MRLQVINNFSLTKHDTDDSNELAFIFFKPRNTEF